MKAPAFTEEGDRWCLCLKEQLNLWIIFYRSVFATGASEGGDLSVFPIEISGFFEKRNVLRI